MSIKFYINKKFIARTGWVIQGCMLLCDFAWWSILYLIRPTPGSFLELLPRWLRMLGADSRFASPLFILALLADIFLPAEPDWAKQRTLAGRVLMGVLVFGSLWVIDTAVFVLVAMRFGWR